MVETLLSRGMNVARIHCAREEPAVWESTTDNVRGASRELERPCLASMEFEET